MADAFDEWAILELFGHRRLAGHVTEQEIAGEGFLRLDIPTDEPCKRCENKGTVREPGLRDGDVLPEITCYDCKGYGTPLKATQFYAPKSVYAITPTTEATARAAARNSRPAPVQRWELEPPATTRTDGGEDDDPWHGGGPF